MKRNFFSKRNAKHIKNRNKEKNYFLKFNKIKRNIYMGKQPFMVSLKVFIRFSWTKLWSIRENRA